MQMNSPAVRWITNFADSYKFIEYFTTLMKEQYKARMNELLSKLMLKKEIQQGRK